MLPQSHAFLALGLTKALQDRCPLFADVDYRKVTLAALLPDLIDKPLAVFVFPEMKAGLLFAHTPIVHLALLWLTRTRPEWFAYALAFTSHIVGDRIWFFRETFWFPLRGFRFHQWKDIGNVKSFGRAYQDLFTRRPALVLYEFGALLVFVWFVLSSRLTDRETLRQFVRTGKLKWQVSSKPIHRVT